VNTFSYRATKAGIVFVAWGGRDVVMLSGARATKFLRQAEDADEESAQLLMARVTGNFKRGNER
jgi:hypothetical protein